MIDVIVTAIEPQAQDILSFDLARADGEPLPAFSAGAHIDVHLPDGLIRQYSLCNHPEERHRYQIAVLRSADSRGGSIAMHGLEQGVRLSISEPRNLFALQHDARRHLLMAGGIGITPILCMAERLSHIGGDFTLHYFARSAPQAAFVERLRQSPFAERVHLHFDDGEASKRPDTAALIGPTQAQTHLYVCGPGGFMAHVLDSARALGWTNDNLHREYFSAEPDDQPQAGFEVQLASSGEVLKVPEGISVVEVLRGIGVEIPVSCEQGICGTCLTRVLEGEPDHRDLFLSEEEQAANDQFTPCCSRAKSARLVLDI
ncbi:oxidoreductase [Pseudomonas sp. PA15(2017)]|uniref:PDR/VanB family oxidoreductase n=1 Tax=Pseudomonas sp. PA15(2017) TaxID=1932111 RepID=UPI000961CE8A|nr:PDR/VanB family oxidoreductase [Pseudomonas sp. PA15(2017)]OLU24389.1 oxidoreductase [Pseudomonas sp. PA15(2017)]